MYVRFVFDLIVLPRVDHIGQKKEPEDKCSMFAVHNQKREIKKSVLIKLSLKFRTWMMK